MRLPLEGLTVLDHSTVGPASRCSSALADLGADIVKIARPTGGAEPPWYAYGAGRGTRRIVVDLQTSDGVEELLDLARSADVVLDSFRPGVADRLGVGYDAVRAVNPGIVYAALTGYGQQGPYADRAGHDLDYLAIGGFLATQGTRPDGGPAIPGATVADSAGGGLHAALVVVAALYRRTATGEGAFLDVAAADGVLWLMSLHLDEHLATGVEPGPGTTLLTGRYACYDVYAARDRRWLAVAAIEPAFFANLCEALGCPQWAAHQYDDERQSEIRVAFRSAFAARDRDDWVAELAAADTCVAPVLSIAEVAADPHFAARGAFVDAEHPDHGTFRQVGAVLAGGSP